MRNKEISVTKKERRKLFNKFSASSEMEELFHDEEKMKAFIISQTGYSQRDNDINDEIDQLSRRLCSQSRSSIINGRSNSRLSAGSRSSITSRQSNQSMTLLGQRTSRTSFNCKS